MKRSQTFLLRASLFFAAFICFVCMQAMWVGAAPKETKTIRVAYPLQEGLTTYDENGNYAGYTYEYLMEISQYTGWKYEFVELEGSMDEQLLEMMDMLEKGELDLMGAVYFDDSLAEKYSYPGLSYGTNYRGIFVPAGSEVTDASLYTMDNVKVGVYDPSFQNSSHLEQFAQMNELNIKQVVTDDYETYKNMVKQGEADALLSADLAVTDHQGMHSVAHFSPSPFYFIATKGNVELTRQLDYAIATIDQVNPNFSVQIFNKYFGSTSDEMYITEEEKTFIQQSEALNVVMYSNKPPFQYTDKKTGKPAGITVEILNRISEETGLKFRYQMVTTYKKYQEMLTSGKADISADTLLSYQDAQELGCTLTQPFTSLPVYLVFRDGTVMEEDSSYAVPYFLENANLDLKDVTYYDTVLECMRAVSEGEKDGCYVGEFCSQYYFNSGEFDDLKFINQQDSMLQKLCFGIRESENHYLLSLFNKAIAQLSEIEKQEMIYRYTYQPQQMPISVFLKKNKTKLAVSALGVLIVLLGVYIFIKSKKQKQIAFENKRYNMLGNLLNEFFYEYDVSSDTLVLGDKCAGYFSCDKMISGFSRKLKDIDKEKSLGIWQLGEYIVNDWEGSLETSCLMKDKSRKWFKIVSANIKRGRGKTYVIGKIADIQDIKTEQLRLEQQASLDGLTGIYNIKTMKQKIYERLADRRDTSDCAFIILDIDNFKQINDQYGHYNGDAVLIQVANLITGIFRPNLTGRLGGDEFIIFAEHMSKEEISRRCEAVCQSTTEKVKALLGAESSLSIGVAMAARGEDYEKLYREADQALYRIKSTTKNGYSIYEEK